jgi:hypothetical protein
MSREDKQEVKRLEDKQEIGRSKDKKGKDEKEIKRFFPPDLLN